MRVDRFANMTPPAIIWQKPAKYTNEMALNLLGSELEKAMPQKEANSFVELMKKICKNLNIEAKNLPINKEHPGSLSPEENFSVYEAVMNATVFNRVV